MPAHSEVSSALISVSVNGETRKVPPGQSLAALLDFLQIPPDRVAIELNKCIVRKRDWQQTAVTPGSFIEIVEFVGGG
jgi:thiamine biosynthesis protein ThiS